MKSFDQLQQETAALHVDFLFTDLNAASTFLDIAETTRNIETRARNVHNATIAHDAVLRFLPRVTMSARQNTDLKEKLDALLARIQTFGLLKPPNEEEIGPDPDSCIQQA